MGIRTSDLCMKVPVDEVAHEQPDYAPLSSVTGVSVIVPKPVNRVQKDKLDRVSKVLGV